jgi:hypothetical protein
MNLSDFDKDWRLLQRYELFGVISIMKSLSFFTERIKADEFREQASPEGQRSFRAA